ncbi:GNAT family N-acetyltransferase [Mycobacterium sp. ACS4331]|uniref:GNAT family N-acetyltransferase n=1 Tax=Mycobacterium sp. ACS4331 TaxID=1834121 RepID=UPI0007FD97FE|nr:GNAT family N-acetyltransferase [Mycobacterium sp. ACS4331]OBF30135.1 GCN5 family acetyltransferase [Mycobacterium sp. ACS4331]
MTFRIRRATVSDLDGAVQTLVAAFDSYAWTRWSIPQDDYRNRLARLQRMYLGYAIDEGVVLVDDELRGVLALLPPDVSAPDFGDQVAQLHGSRLEAIAAVDIPAHPDGAWNLATVGVHPGSQGHGLGAALVHAALEVDPAAGVALETSDERNVRLYERAGFAVTATTSIPDGPMVYSMYADPRRPR